MAEKKSKKIILENGLRLLYIPQEKGGVCGMGIAISAGPYFEETHLSGISHLLEHLISRLPAEGKTLREEIYANGGILDAATSVAQTFYHVFAHQDDFVAAVKNLIHGVFFPNFSDSEVFSAKESIISEMAYIQKNYVYEILRQIIWKDEKLSKPLIGTKTSIYSIKLKDLENYHKGRYSADKTSVVIITPEFPQEVQKLLSEIPKGTPSPLSVDTSVNNPTFRLFQEKNLHSRIIFGFPTKGYRKLGEERHIFNLSAEILNASYISQLAKLGLLYESGWSWNLFPESGEFILEFEGLEKEHLTPLIKKGLELIAGWQKLEISDKEFSLAKKHKILALKMGESLESTLPLLTKNFSSSEEAHTYEEAIKVYDASSLKDTLKVVSEVILTDKPFLVVSLGLDSEEKDKEIEGYLASIYNA